MVILGLILLLLAAALGVAAFYGLPTASSQIRWTSFFGNFDISAVTVFILGALTMLLLLLGLWLLLAGTKRSARKSRELRDLKKQQKESAKLNAERERQAVRERDAERARLQRETADRVDDVRGPGATNGTDLDGPRH